jgi:hypothetical protein
VAENGDAGIDRVGTCEPGAAAAAGFSLAAVDEELELEVAALARAGAVVPERGALSRDGGPENPPDLRVHDPPR